MKTIMQLSKLKKKPMVMPRPVPQRATPQQGPKLALALALALALELAPRMVKPQSLLMKVLPEELRLVIARSTQGLGVTELLMEQPYLRLTASLAIPALQLNEAETQIRLSAPLVRFLR